MTILALWILLNGSPTLPADPTLTDSRVVAAAIQRLTALVASSGRVLSIGDDPRKGSTRFRESHREHHRPAFSLPRRQAPASFRQSRSRDGRCRARVKLHRSGRRRVRKAESSSKKLSSPLLRTTLLLVALLAVLEAPGVARTGQPTVEDALKAIERGDYSQAEALLATDPDLQLLKGIVEFHQGKYGDARDARTALAQRDAPIGRLFLALATAATSGCANALDDLRAFFERQPPSDASSRGAGAGTVPCRGRARFRGNADAGPLANSYPADEDVLFQTAKLHMKGWNDAVDRMFQQTPASFRVNQISAEIFEIQGRYAEAMVEYRKSIAKRPHASTPFSTRPRDPHGIERSQSARGCRAGVPGRAEAQSRRWIAHINSVDRDRAAECAGSRLRFQRALALTLSSRKPFSRGPADEPSNPAAQSRSWSGPSVSRR